MSRPHVRSFAQLRRHDSSRARGHRRSNAAHLSKETSRREGISNMREFWRLNCEGLSLRPRSVARESLGISTLPRTAPFSLWTLQRSRVSIVCGPHTPKVLLMRCLRGSSQQSLCFCFLTLYQRLKDFSTSGQVEGRRASSHTLRQRPISPETIVAFHSSCRTSP